jgi:multiple sugar transport system ATP-binding protein
VIEEAVTAGGDDETSLLAGFDRALFAARVDARTKARVGQMIRLSVDPSRMHFFEPETGESLLSERAVAA